MSLSPEHPGLSYSILKNSIKHENVMGIRAAMALCVKPSLGKSTVRVVRPRAGGVANGLWDGRDDDGARRARDAGAGGLGEGDGEKADGRRDEDDGTPVDVNREGTNDDGARAGLGRRRHEASDVGR